jgi:hypothetical protein
MRSQPPPSIQGPVVAALDVDHHLRSDRKQRRVQERVHLGPGRTHRQAALEDREEQQFWQGVRASPRRTARDIRSRLKDIDRRLADIESYVTTENRSLAREIEQLR